MEVLMRVMLFIFSKIDKYEIHTFINILYEDNYNLCILYDLILILIFYMRVRVC